jgi:uncharacterized membrane-anchored protein
MTNLFSLNNSITFILLVILVAFIPKLLKIVCLAIYHTSSQRGIIASLHHADELSYDDCVCSLYVNSDYNDPLLSKKNFIIFKVSPDVYSQIVQLIEHQNNVTQLNVVNVFYTKFLFTKPTITRVIDTYEVKEVLKGE